jgi:hypothetical protein
MAEDKKYTKKLFLRLQTNGYIVIDDDYLWDGCDTPEIDPEIELTPVSLLKLTQLISDLYSDDNEIEDIERFEKLLAEMNASADVIEQRITAIKTKFP